MVVPETRRMQKEWRAGGDGQGRVSPGHGCGFLHGFTWFRSAVRRLTSAPERIPCVPRFGLVFDEIDSLSAKARSVWLQRPWITEVWRRRVSAKFFGTTAHAYVLMVRAQVDMAAGRFEEAVPMAQKACQLDTGSREAVTVCTSAPRRWRRRGCGAATSSGLPSSPRRARPTARA